MTKYNSSHPSVSLPRAFDKARAFFHAWGREDASYEDTLRSWGYAPDGKPGRDLVSTMIDFGLLNKTAPQRGSARLRLDESAVATLLEMHANSDARSSAIMRMALRPVIYLQVWNRWGVELPDGESFRRYAMETLNLNPRSIGRFMRCYTETFEFAKHHVTIPDREESKVVLEFDEDELLDVSLAGSHSEDRDDTDLSTGNAQATEDISPIILLSSDDEDTDLDQPTTEDELQLQPVARSVADDHVDLDTSRLAAESAEEKRFTRLSTALQPGTTRADPAMRELGRYALRNDCTVALYADGKLDRETLENLFTHLLADLVLGAFETRDDDS